MKLKVFIMMLLIGVLSFGGNVGSLGGWWLTSDSMAVDQAVVEFYRTGDSYEGKIISITVKDPKTGSITFNDRDPLVGFVLLHGFKKDPNNPNIFEGGYITNPKNDKVYYAKLTVEGKKLRMKGSLDKYGIFGATRVWIKIK